MTESISKTPFDAIRSAFLNADDDPALWATVLEILTEEFIQGCEKLGSGRCALVIGACSHWVRPHNSLWPAAGGFAYPQGYKDSMPEFDWSITLLLRDGTLRPARKLPGGRTRVFRAAVPTRTTKHNQAAVNTRWLPGQKTILYGFRRIDGEWRCVAASDEASNGRILARA